MNPSPKTSTYKIWEPLLMAGFTVLGMIAGYNLFEGKSDELIEISSLNASNTHVGIGRVEEIIRILENSYVDEIESDDLVKDVVENIISKLDPHSSYISPEELKEYNQRMEGIYRGIGIESLFVRDTLYVSHVNAGSKAEAAGLLAGDIILEIGKDTLFNKGKTVKDVQEVLRNWEGNVVDFKILRKKKEALELDINLQKTDVQSASTHYLLNNNTGYLKINRFSANTYDQFFKSLESISNQLNTDKFNLVLDLRDNPGGYLPQSLKILSQLFNSKDKLLSFTIGEHRKRKEYKSTGRNFYNVDKLSVLINDNSASASEIVAGAVQDWDRGVVIGQASYGKGLVQEIFPLKNNGAIRLTVARYCTPSGRQIQKPYKEIEEGETQEDSTFFTKKYERKIFNNSGISPDFIVEETPFDFYKNGMVDSVACKILPFVDKLELQYLTDHESALANQTGMIGTLDIQNAGFSEDQIRAELIYAWYGASDYYKYIQREDPYILRAMELIEVENPLQQLASKEN